MENTAIIADIVIKLAGPELFDAISNTSIIVAGIAHIFQCMSLTDRVWKSERAAMNIHEKIMEILIVDNNGSGDIYISG